jgi:hypothetical protein
LLRDYRQVGLEVQVAELVRALDDDPGSDPNLTAALHHGLRAVRRADQNRFDEIWLQNQALPPWLTINVQLIDLADEWVKTPTWASSRALLDEHTEIMLSPEFATALDEILLADSQGRTALQHRQILTDATSTSIDAAYAPYLRQELAVEWASIDDPSNSAAFLRAHQADLTTAEAIGALDQTLEYRHRSLASLAATDHTDLALALAADADTPINLREHQRNADPATLHALATLLLLRATNTSETTAAQTGLAIALALAGHDDAAQTSAASIAGSEEAKAAVIQVTEAISARPDDAALLTPLLQALLSDR